jgi:hypothetical protein
MRERNRVSIWCSVVTATALAVAPITVRAEFSEPGGEEQPDATQPETERPGVQPPAPGVEGPTPPEPSEARANSRSRILRRTGTGVMTTGGVIAASGLGVTIAFTVIGDQRSNADDPVLEQVEQANRVAQIGGILLASGLALIAIGGIVYTRAHSAKRERPVARLRMAPTAGGVIVSGQF